jgi:CheY-like chemotaxis protein
MAHVLIVDDDRETSRLFVRLLERLGHRVDCLHRGEEVIEHLRCIRFDLVLLDAAMAGMDGFAVLATIRSDLNPVIRATPVMLYAPFDDPFQRERALTIGANDWLVTDTPLPVLERKLDKFLAQR